MKIFIYQKQDDIIMKKLFLTLLAFLFIIFSNSCKPDKAEICYCFVKQGIPESSALIGEWDLESYGYTIDGEAIKEKEKIDKGRFVFYESGKFSLIYWNEMGGDYFLYSRNGIFCPIVGGSLMLPPGKKEIKKEELIVECVNNFLCYKIENNKLYIHFSKVQNFNVLILSKRIEQ